jgi:hypothetical protein
MMKNLRHEASYYSLFKLAIITEGEPLTIYLLLYFLCCFKCLEENEYLEVVH